MTGAPTLAVTGSTGHLGGLVARLLAEAGTPQRLLVRDLHRAPDLEHAVPVVVSYADPVLAKAALAGVTTLFMVSAAEAEDRLQQHYTFVDAAAAAGVQHVVYTSFFGAAADSVFTLGRDHFATEEHIKASGMDFTFLRDNFYLDFLPLLACPARTPGMRCSAAGAPGAAAGSGDAAKRASSGPRSAMRGKACTTAKFESGAFWAMRSASQSAFSRPLPFSTTYCERPTERPTLAS